MVAFFLVYCFPDVFSDLDFFFFSPLSFFFFFSGKLRLDYCQKLVWEGELVEFYLNPVNN